MRWQRHQLDHMQVVCASLKTDNHASTSSLSIFTGRMLFLKPNQVNQQRQSTSKTQGCSGGGVRGLNAPVSTSEEEWHSTKCLPS